MISVIAILTGTLLIIISSTVSLLNRKRFNEICKLYKAKYGSLPDAVLLFENVNSLYVKGEYGIKYNLYTCHYCVMVVHLSLKMMIRTSLEDYRNG